MGSLAQRRLARGVRLNHPEAVALIASQLQELARDGSHSVAELMQIGRTMLGELHMCMRKFRAFGPTNQQIFQQIFVTFFVCFCV